jgi:hypothetical protein
MPRTFSARIYETSFIEIYNFGILKNKKLKIIICIIAFEFITLEEDKIYSFENTLFKECI